MTTPIAAYQNYIPYYIETENKNAAIPAIFVRDANHHQKAKLFLIKEQWGTESPTSATEKAQHDLAEALKILLPLSSMAANEGMLKVALFRQGYIWPGVEPYYVEFKN